VRTKCKSFLVYNTKYYRVKSDAWDPPDVINLNKNLQFYICYFLEKFISQSFIFLSYAKLFISQNFDILFLLLSFKHVEAGCEATKAAPCPCPNSGREIQMNCYLTTRDMPL